MSEMFDLIIRNTDIKKFYLSTNKNYRITRAGGNNDHLIVKTPIIISYILPFKVSCYLGVLIWIFHLHEEERKMYFVIFIHS